MKGECLLPPAGLGARERKLGLVRLGTYKLNYSQKFVDLDIPPGRAPFVYQQNIVKSYQAFHNKLVPINWHFCNSLDGIESKQSGNRF